MLNITSMNLWVQNLVNQVCTIGIVMDYILGIVMERNEQISIHSLGLATRRAEKTKPSCLDFVLVFREAARIKHQSSPHLSLRDCVWNAVAEYNKTVSKDLLLKHPFVFQN